MIAIYGLILLAFYLYYHTMLILLLVINSVIKLFTIVFLCVDLLHIVMTICTLSAII